MNLNPAGLLAALSSTLTLALALALTLTLTLTPTLACTRGRLLDLAHVRDVALQPFGHQLPQVRP